MIAKAVVELRRAVAQNYTCILFSKRQGFSSVYQPVFSRKEKNYMYRINKALRDREQRLYLFRDEHRKMGDANIKSAQSLTKTSPVNYKSHDKIFELPTTVEARVSGHPREAD